MRTLFLSVQLINDALKRVQTERQDELKARREARQAQQVKHAAQQAERAAKHAAQQAERAAKHAAKPVAESQQLEASRAAAQPLEGKISQQQQQQGAEQRHHQEPPAANGKAEPHALKRQQAAEEGKASQKAGALLQDAAALKRQEKILSAGNIPDNVRLELSAQNVAPSAADGAPGKASAALAEEPKASTAGRAGKAGAPKRKRLQLDDSSDDEELAAVRGVKAAVLPDSAAKGKQTTPAKAAKRANDANPGEAARGHAFARRDSEPNEGNEDEAEREARKMREAAEKVTCPATPLVMSSQRSSGFDMPASGLCTGPGRERGAQLLQAAYMGLIVGQEGGIAG